MADGTLRSKRQCSVTSNFDLAAIRNLLAVRSTVDRHIKLCSMNCLPSGRVAAFQVGVTTDSFGTLAKQVGPKAIGTPRKEPCFWKR